MPLPKIEEVRKLNAQELANEILTAKRELFELRLQQATRRLEKPHQFKHLRHRIAQMLTVERERQVTKAQTPTDTPTTNENPATDETNKGEE